MLLDLSLPPGAFRNGTAYQARGRYYDVNRVRWFGNALGPIGGWRLKTGTAVSGAARAVIAWRDNSKVAWAAIGTHTHLYVMDLTGVVSDITPVATSSPVEPAFSAGAGDSTYGGGFGSGDFGEGLFGTPRLDGTNIQPASLWTLDTRGQNLVGCMEMDGRLFEWTLNTGLPAARILNSPTASACFVTNEGAVVALGAEGNPRRVKFSDAENDTIWAPDATNTAGGFNLQTYGSLRCGKRIRGGQLLFTDLDVWSMTATRDVLVYGFEQIGMACGVISPQAVAVIDEKAVWMSQDGFWLYNGGVSTLPCDVRDYVFNDFNLLQSVKTYAVRNAEFSEVTWYYPSALSEENDRYVTYNYQTGAWSFGALARTSGCDKSVFDYPLLIDPDGVIWEHEVGFDYPDGILPHAEGGALELGAGDNVMRVTSLVPDELTGGDVKVSFNYRFQPNAGMLTAGPYALSPRTDVRFTARQIGIRYQGAREADWRVGVMRADASPAGLR